MASPISGAIFNDSNLSDAKIASVGAMVLVNSNFSSFEALTVMPAKTRHACRYLQRPGSMSAAAAFRVHCRRYRRPAAMTYSTLPIIFITSLSPARWQRLSTMARSAPVCCRCAGTTPPTSGETTISSSLPKRWLMSFTNTGAAMRLSVGMSKNP